MNHNEIETTLIGCDYAVNNARYSVVNNTSGVHYLHIDDFDDGQSFLKLNATELAEAEEIADAFPRRDSRRAFALEKMAQRLRRDRYLR